MSSNSLESFTIMHRSVRYFLHVFYVLGTDLKLFYISLEMRYEIRNQIIQTVTISNSSSALAQLNRSMRSDRWANWIWWKNQFQFKHWFYMTYHIYVMRIQRFSFQLFSTCVKMNIMETLSHQQKRKEKNFQSSFRSETFWHQLTKTNKYPQIKPMNSGFAARYQWIYQSSLSQFLFSSNSTHFFF